MRKPAFLALLALALFLVAATPKPKPKAEPIAPAKIEHVNALFLSDLSNSGKRPVTFRASAIGTMFFFEEPLGVTVYRFSNGGYEREEFLRGMKLAGAMKKYAVR